MQLFPEVADPFDEVPFDEGLDVLVVRVAEDRGIGRDGLLQRLEGGFEATEFVRIEDARAFQRPGPGGGSRDVLWKEPAIEGQRVVEPLEQVVHPSAESSAPDRVRQDGLVGGGAHDPAPSAAASAVSDPFADCIAAIRLGSEKSRMNPSACDWS